MNQPEAHQTLTTERLRLRPLAVADAECVQEYAGDLEVARWTCLIPHPYPEGAAREWIESLGDGSDRVFAIVLAATDELIGVIGVHPDSTGKSAEIGFWIGVPHWGHGYMTEAAREILRHCFEDLGLQRIFAGHFDGNEASGRVQQKIGMRKEGFHPWGHWRFGEPRDRVTYGIIRPDWEALQER